MVFLFVGPTNGRVPVKIGKVVETNMFKIIPPAKNHKNYDDIPDGLKWAIPIHECLESPGVKERSRRLEEESKASVEKELCKKKIKIVE